MLDKVPVVLSLTSPVRTFTGPHRQADCYINVKWQRVEYNIHIPSHGLEQLYELTQDVLVRLSTLVGPATREKWRASFPLQATTSLRAQALGKQYLHGCQ
jgi:hypothetical protein